MNLLLPRFWVQMFLDEIYMVIFKRATDETG